MLLFDDQDIKPLVVGGIDTLYYFAQSNEKYDDFFIDMLEELDIQKQKGGYLINKDSALSIELNGIRLYYTGNPEGYHYFKDEGEIVYIGFKDSFRQKNLHDIRIRLQAKGIYAIGLKTALEYVDSFIKDISTDERHITRIDVNAFVNVDFSRLCSYMFSTKKRFSGSIFNEFRSSNILQTLYIGKPPFRLRIYNKKIEMDKSKDADKKIILTEYLQTKGFTYGSHIWNVEFEIHREFLKQFKIYSPKQALQNAENLFRQACDYIRLVDVNSIDVDDIKNGHKNRAKTLPIWEEIKNGYKIESFLQLSAPLERVKKRVKKYDYSNAFTDAVMLAWRMEVNGYEMDDEFLANVKEELKNKKEIQTQKSVTALINFVDNTQKVNVVSFASMSDYMLTREHYILTKRFFETKNPDNHLVARLKIADHEMQKRGLLEDAEKLF